MIVRPPVDGCASDSAPFTWTVNEAVPSAVGVPEISPDELFSDKPVGNFPLKRDQVYGAVPPVADSVALYLKPTDPSGKLVVVTDDSRPEPEIDTMNP